MDSYSAEKALASIQGVEEELSKLLSALFAVQASAKPYRDANLTADCGVALMRLQNVVRHMVDLKALLKDDR